MVWIELLLSSVFSGWAKGLTLVGQEKINCLLSATSFDSGQIQNPQYYRDYVWSDCQIVSGS